MKTTMEKKLQINSSANLKAKRKKGQVKAQLVIVLKFKRLILNADFIKLVVVMNQSVKHAKKEM